MWRRQRISLRLCSEQAQHRSPLRLALLPGSASPTPSRASQTLTFALGRWERRAPAQQDRGAPAADGLHQARRGEHRALKHCAAPHRAEWLRMPQSRLRPRSGGGPGRPGGGLRRRAGDNWRLTAGRSRNRRAQYRSCGPTHPQPPTSKHSGAYGAAGRAPATGKCNGRALRPRGEPVPREGAAGRRGFWWGRAGGSCGGLV